MLALKHKEKSLDTPYKEESKIEKMMKSNL